MFFVTCKKRSKAFSHFVSFGPAVFLSASFLFLFATTASAQTCSTAIQNNTISLSQAVCTGTVGYLQGSTPTGGNGTYTYQWEGNPNNCTGNGGYSIIPGATSKDYPVPSAADPNLCYRRVVTSGACTSTSNSMKVDIPDRTTPSPPTTTVVQPNCVLGTGSVTVTNPAPAAGITYSINGTTYTTSNTFLNLAPGTYSVTAKFPIGCVSPASSVVLNMPIPSGTISPGSATICTGGSQLLTVSGGTSYQWYRNGLPILLATGSTYLATQAGTYTVTITAGICSATAMNSAVVTVVPPPSGTVSPATTSICAGNSVTLSATGGSTYEWFKDGVQQSGATGATFVATQAGVYSVIISNGTCSVPASNTATVSVEALPTGTISPGGSASVCFGSSQTLSVSGGASYQWNRNNQSINGANASTFPATLAGVYTVDINSSSGCKGSATNSVSLTVLPLPTGTITPATVSICAGSSATLTATGGVSYLWYKDGQAQNNATTSTFIAIDAGHYAVDIYDAVNCKGKASNESVVTVVAIPTGTVSPGTSVLCPGSTVTLTASGGTSYQWYKDGTLITGATAATYPVSQSGSYTADIILGTCKGRTSNAGVVTQGVTPTGSITPGSGSICSGNNIVLTASGGTSYQWSKDGIQITTTTGAVLNVNQTGTYSVTIFNNGCSGPASNSVVISPSTPITFTPAHTDPSCTSTTGSITVTNPAGGAGSGYSYSKDNGITFQTGNVFTGLAAATYQIVVKDAAGCKSTPVSVVISPFTSTLQGSASITNITCTQSSGSAVITASGGTAPYQYSLDGGAYQSGNAFSNLSLGAHKVTVKDSPGCNYDVSFTITQVASTLAATFTTTNASCGQPNGAVAIQAAGGAPGYTYSLDNGAFQTSNSFSNLSVTSHKVTVKDNAGCTFDVNFTITQTAAIPNLVITNPAKVCPGSTADLKSSAVTSGSDTGLVYSYWTDAAAGTALQTPNAVLAGTYYIKATNRGGCSAVKPVDVSLQTVFPGSITVTRTLACFTDTLPLTASGGRGYKWFRNDTLINGATSLVYLATQTGTYSVQINDGTCLVKAANSVKLEFKACTPIYDARALVPTAFTPNRNGTNDLLRPILYNVTSLHYFKVYNRWGQLVFETATIGKGWDGNKDGVPQPSETYSWILECEGKSGNIVKASGRSLLIR